MDKDKRLEERKAGRSAAIAVHLVALGEVEGKSMNFVDAFWDELMSRLEDHIQVKVEVVKAKPMNDEEAREFEKEKVPFKGVWLDGFWRVIRPGTSVQTADLDVLRGLANYDFLDKLRRYLARDEIQRLQF